MPRIAPKNLRPFLFHGVDLSWEDGKEEALGNCPFCGRDNKFSVRIDSGQWRCFVCGTGSEKGGGNIMSFLRYLWEESDKATDGASKDLAVERKFLYPETVTHWGVCQSVSTGEWLAPGYGTDKKLHQLYKWSLDVSSGKRRLFATPDCHHQIYGLNHWDETKQDVYICEGIWDAMAFWEVLRASKTDDDGNLSLTGIEANSLISKANIIGVPGCNVFSEEWVNLLSNRNVIFMYHSDHPKEHKGRTLPPAGFAGMKRAIEMVSKVTECVPRSVSYLDWGRDGYDRNKPSGFDARDVLSEGNSMAERVALLQELLSRVKPIPVEWVPGRTFNQGAGGTDIACRPCKRWDELVNQWKKAMDWFEGMDRALSIMLASVASTMCVGEQLWFKVLGPASSGKSTLCEALSINKRYIYPKSTIRGFHSGYKTDKEGKDDYGLLVQVNGKTLVTKDGDTLLQSPDLPRILAEGRDVFDRCSRTHYRHGVSRDYEDVNMTWLLCGTNALRSIDSSELGERFLDTVIIEEIDEDRERETALRVAYAALRASCLHAGQRREDKEKILAKQMTGGYVDYLRQNVHELSAQVIETFQDRYLARCRDLAKLISLLRARPSSRQKEKAEREMCYRLTNQLTRLAVYLTVVLNKKEVDTEVIRRVTQVAFDTGRGIALEIIRAILEAKEEQRELTFHGLMVKTKHSEKEERLQVWFMQQIKVIESKTEKNLKHYTLSPNLEQLYLNCLGGLK